MRATPLLLPILLSTLACVTVPEDSGTAGRGGDGAKTAETAQKKDADAEVDDRADKLRKKQRETDKKHREQRYAGLELEIARKKADSDAEQAELKVAETFRALEEAKRALEHFRAVEGPLKAARSDLDLQRAERRLVEARQDLEGILAIYDEEVEAPSKDAVIQRHETQVMFAERELAIAKRTIEVTRAKDIEKTERDLVWAVEKATAEHDRAVEDRERERATAELDLLKKEAAIKDLALDLEELQRELDKLRTEA